MSPARNDIAPEKRSFDRTVLFILIILEAVLFASFYTREVAWFPPDNFDQASYLLETYRLQERVLTHDLGELWTALSSGGHAAGVLFPIEGALAGIIIGGTRLPQLGVLFLGFCALQVAAFITAKAVWGRVYGYSALGLILCQTTLWCSFGGGLFDFRMDFLAYCLYGVWACLAIRSHVFLHRWWSLGCGLIGAFLVLNRFVTITYLLGVSAGFALVCGLVSFFWRGNAFLVSRMRHRFLHLGLSTGALILVTAPILIRNWRAIRAYYVAGHVMGQERFVRAAVLGITDLWGHLTYYPNSITQDHLGNVFLWASGITIVCGLAARLLGRSWREKPVINRDETFLLQIIFLIGAVLGPIIVLTVDISKSPVVGSIVGGPVALLVVAVAAAVGPRPGLPERLTGRRLLIASALAVLSLGLFNQLSQASHHWPAYANRDDLRQLDELDKSLIDLAIKYGWRSPGVSYDVITGWLNAGPPTISAFEQSRNLIEFHPMLGNGVLGVNWAQALSFLQRSDFLILTNLPKVGAYPFYQQIASYWNDLKAWADSHMVVARIIPFSNFTATLYIRPTARISDTSGGWITSQGLSIEVLRAALEKFPMIRLSGSADYSQLSKIPGIDARIDTGETSQKIPASFRRVDGGYEILIDTSQIRFPPTADVQIRLHFDSFFVPEKNGAKGDTRELVVKAPALIELFRTGLS